MDKIQVIQWKKIMMKMGFSSPSTVWVKNDQQCHVVKKLYQYYHNCINIINIKTNWGFFLRHNKYARKRFACLLHILYLRGCCFNYHCSLKDHHYRGGVFGSQSDLLFHMQAASFSSLSWNTWQQQGVLKPKQHAYQNKILHSTQKHAIAYVGRDLWRLYSPIHLLKQGHL